MGPRVVAIALAQLLLHNNNRSHLVHTADWSNGDSSIVSYQQTFTLHTTDRPTQEEQGESDSRKHTGTRTYHHTCFKLNR